MPIKPEQRAEVDLMRMMEIQFSNLGSWMFRNNVGMGWAGKAFRHPEGPIEITLHPGDVIVRDARPLHAGLCEGSSDLIGFQPVVITQEMVGKKVAVFMAGEVKKSKKAKRTQHQTDFIENVKRNGGKAAFLDSEADVAKLLSSPIL